MKAVEHFNIVRDGIQTCQEHHGFLVGHGANVGDGSMCPVAMARAVNFDYNPSHRFVDGFVCQWDVPGEYALEHLRQGILEADEFLIGTVVAACLARWCHASRA